MFNVSIQPANYLFELSNHSLDYFTHIRGQHAHTSQGNMHTHQRATCTHFREQHANTSEGNMHTNHKATCTHLRCQVLLVLCVPTPMSVPRCSADLFVLKNDKYLPHSVRNIQVHYKKYTQKHSAAFLVSTWVSTYS